jgi:hypothetical protein
MSDFKCLVSISVDLSRLDRNPHAEIQLRRLLAVGREIDLLEALRRSEKKAQLTIETVLIHATGLGIDSELVESSILQSFQEYKMIDIDDSRVILNYTETSEVYGYGKVRLDEKVTEKELKFAEFICRSTKGAIPIDELDKILELFPREFRFGLRNFLLENNVLKTFTSEGTEYVISPRIYKDEKKFREAVEILSDHGLKNIVDFVQENPGNPLPVAEEYLHTNQQTLDLLGQSGIIDPIRLDVRGDVKDYLYSSDILNRRDDKDHFDLVRKTLANFRFGEYYSEKTRLYNLDRFLEYMLDHGYAGSAEAIGTDYVNLEWAGIFKIKKLLGTKNYRFWMLKRDVVEDVRSILRGYIPIQSSLKVGELSKIEGVVQTRGKIRVSLDPTSMKEIAKALRQIEDGLTSS